MTRSAASPRRGPAPPPDAASHPFPIIGIGASAGGLDALERFLGNIPPGSGLGFVIVQHLDPTHKGIMPEILQRSARIPVAQVRDRLKVERDHVYVIPPNKDMSILHGVLHLFPPSAPRGLRLPIDFFLRSLAADQRERSVGIILSGMGTDGTLGVKAVKDGGGMVMVQDPRTAKFDGMPRSAVDTGVADYIGSPEELGGKIVDILRRPPFPPMAGPCGEAKVESSLEKVVILLRAHTGHDFSLYKKSTLYRRIERRMGIHQIDRISHYVRFLQENDQERNFLFKEMLIGVTSFFRDPASWEYLRAQVLPALFASRATGETVRAWTPGCSTGEEAFSLGMVFREALDLTNPRKRLAFQVFATDLDPDAVEKARQGIFPANIHADVSPERLQRFFLKEEGAEPPECRYRIGREIREMVTLAVQDVLRDPPFTKLDILVCRNLLIYLEPEAQKNLLSLFHYSLNPGGTLFLGSAETTSGLTDLFGPLDSGLRLFRRKESPRRRDLEGFPVFASSPPPPRIPGDPHPKPVSNIQTLAEQELLKRFSPPSVLVNRTGDILFVNGRTGKYLEPSSGRANLNVFAMAREGLRYDLMKALQKAAQGKKAVTVRGLKVKTNSHFQAVDLTVQPVQQPAALGGTFFVVFADVPEPPDGKRRLRPPKTSSPPQQFLEMDRELRDLREELQTTQEEMQASQEELKSANEELQSANEELQSTNEELTTSKEEMQSLNEELQTVNSELQSKVDELLRANNDMKNLLNSTEIATVFLDNALLIRRFTTQATHIIKLLPGDVGRPVTDIATDLVYPDLPQDVQEVLRTLSAREKQIPARDGRWFTGRIMPYRTIDNVIDGVVLTFADITLAKKLEAELRRLSSPGKLGHDEGET